MPDWLGGLTAVRKWPWNSPRCFFLNLRITQCIQFKPVLRKGHLYTTPIEGSRTSLPALHEISPRTLHCPRNGAGSFYELTFQGSGKHFQLNSDLFYLAVTTTQLRMRKVFIISDFPWQVREGFSAEVCGQRIIRNNRALQKQIILLPTHDSKRRLAGAVQKCRTPRGSRVTCEARAGGPRAARGVRAADSSETPASDALPSLNGASFQTKIKVSEKTFYNLFYHHQHCFVMFFIFDINALTYDAFMRLKKLCCNVFWWQAQAPQFKKMVVFSVLVLCFFRNHTDPFGYVQNWRTMAPSK